jgi:phage-related protein
MADTSIGKAYVQIIPQAKGISGQIEGVLGKDAEKGGESAGNSFASKMVGAIKKVAIAAGVAKIFKDAIDAGADLQQSYGGLDTIYGDASDAAKEYAEQAYKAGISANDYAEQAVSFGASLKQAFGGDTSKAVEAANTAIMDMTDNAAKMGTPIENIQNAYQGFAKQNYTMLDNLKLGYGGTKEEMERLLSDAEKLSGQEYDISNLGDVYDAIHVIQEDLGLTGVAAQEASETFSGSFGAMTAAAQNLLANLALGNNVTDEFQALGQTVQTFVVGNLLPMIGNIVKQIPSLVAQLPGMIADFIPQVIPAIGSMVAGMAQGIVDNLPVWIEGVSNLMTTAWDALVNFDWSSAGQIMADLLIAAWEGLKTAASGIWDFIVGIFTGEVEFPDLGEMARPVWNALTTVASEIWTSVKNWFTKTFTWPNIAEGARTVWSALTGVASTVWNAVKTWFQKTFTFPSLVEFARSAWNGLTTLASSIWNAIKAWFQKTFTFPSLTEAARGVWNGLTTAAQSVWNAIKNWFQKTFSFPSLDALAKAAWDTLTGIAGGVWEAIKGVFGATDITFADVSEAASAAWDTITTAATTVWDGIKDIFGSFDIEWPDFGELASGALEGLKNAAKGVWDWVKGLFSGDSDNEAVKSVQGSTEEMAAAFADAELKISSVDVSSIQTANEFIKNTVLGWTRMFDGMKLKLPTVASTALEACSQVVSSWVNTYKKTMKFSWTLPTLHGKLPVISVSMQTASSSDGKTSVSYPNLSVSSFKWFAKGGIFNDPTVIGIGDSKGPEAAVPLDMMWRQLGKEFDKHFENAPSVTNYFDIHSDSPQDTATEIARTLKMQLRMA